MSCFFFFQAEDGIRDRHVTGVQTCALPILRATVRRDPRLIELPDGRWECGLRLLEGSVLTHRVRSSTSGRDLLFLGEIGRASCREEWCGRGGRGEPEGEWGTAAMPRAL